MSYIKIFCKKEFGLMQEIYEEQEIEQVEDLQEPQEIIKPIKR